MFIADHLNNVIRKVALTGTITTVAHADSPWGVAADTRGNIYYEDGPGVFKASPDGTVTPFAGTNPTSYDLGDGGPAASAYLSHPVGLATDRRGNVYIADSAHNRIRRVGSDGTITTVAGTGSPGFSGDGGPATKARLKAPWVVTVDAGGNLYIGDSGNRRVRKVTPGGTISTIAGSGASRDSPDGTRALKASFYNVFGLAVDRSGTVYIADGIARVYALRAGRVSTFAGDASGDKGGFGGDGGVARRALLDHPQGLAVDAHSDLYIADLYNNRVRKVTGPK
ncbi:MAG: hypothetical protein ACJ76I_14860 [Gaiellaceae bacterium]